jgi:hypothetical protein
LTVTLSERAAIERMMGYIEKERERLWGQYTTLLDRLRELDEIERPFVEEVKAPVIEIKHVVKEEPEAETEAPEPFIEEVAVTAEVEEKEEVAEEPIEEMESETQSLADIIEQAKEKLNSTKPNYIKEIEEIKDRDAKNNPLKNNGTRDVKIVAQFARAILKEKGVPMRTKELIKKLEEANINMSSPYVLLNQVRAHDPKIETVGHGYYQYKW